MHLLVQPLQNRAQAATELLQELNSDVSGNFVEEVGKTLDTILEEMKMLGFKYLNVYC